MDFSEVVKKRKSIRRFQPKQVEEEKIEKILELVNLAPSAGNLQAYKIFVVKNEEVKKEIIKGSFYQSWVKDAPCLLVFCADPQESAFRYGQRGANLYALQDATIAASYAQLAVVDLGLSSVWVGSFDTGKVQQALGTTLLPIGIFPIGYPAEDPERPERKSLEELVKVTD